MSFWRVISEAQSLRTEFLRTTERFQREHEQLKPGILAQPNKALA